MSQNRLAVCAAPNCKELFEKRTPNHLYHSKRCKRDVENESKRRQLTRDVVEVLAPSYGLENEAESIEFLRREVQRLGREVVKHKTLNVERHFAVHNAIVEGLSNFSLDPIIPPELESYGSEEVAVIGISDVQLSKVTPTYNSEIAEQRMYEYIERCLEETELRRACHTINQARVWMLGDIVEGEGIFPGQGFSTDAGFYRQVTIHGPRIFANCLRRLLEYFDYVEVHCVIGNHGRLGTRAREEFDPETNGDRMLYRVLDHIFANEERIKFVIPDGPGQRSWYDIDTIGNYSSLLMHGDQFLSIQSLNTVKTRLMGWKESVPEVWQDAAMGHFHQSMRFTFGKTVLRVFGTTESDNFYAQEKLSSTAISSQHLMFVDPSSGIVANEIDIILK